MFHAFVILEEIVNLCKIVANGMFNLEQQLCKSHEISFKIAINYSTTIGVNSTKPYINDFEGVTNSKLKQQH